MGYIQLQDIKLLDFTRILIAKKTNFLKTNVNDDKNPVYVFKKKKDLVDGVNMEPFPSLRTSVIHEPYANMFE